MQHLRLSLLFENRVIPTAKWDQELEVCNPVSSLAFLDKGNLCVITCNNQKNTRNARLLL